MNHNQARGVLPAADEVEIREAWRACARRHHTDGGGGDEEKFRQAREAYEVLRDPERRRRYDEELRTGRGPGPTTAPATAPRQGDLEADLTDLLGRPPTARQSAGARLVDRGLDLFRRLVDADDSPRGRRR